MRTPAAQAHRNPTLGTYASAWRHRPILAHARQIQICASSSPAFNPTICLLPTEWQCIVFPRSHACATALCLAQQILRTQLCLSTRRCACVLNPACLPSSRACAANSMTTLALSALGRAKESAPLGSRSTFRNPTPRLRMHHHRSMQSTTPAFPNQLAMSCPRTRSRRAPPTSISKTQSRIPLTKRWATTFHPCLMG